MPNQHPFDSARYFRLLMMFFFLHFLCFFLALNVFLHLPRQLRNKLECNVFTQYVFSVDLLYERQIHTRRIKIHLRNKKKTKSKLAIYFFGQFICEVFCSEPRYSRDALTVCVAWFAVYIIYEVKARETVQQIYRYFFIPIFFGALFAENRRKFARKSTTFYSTHLNRSICYQWRQLAKIKERTSSMLNVTEYVVILKMRNSADNCKVRSSNPRYMINMRIFCLLQWW